jgi:hypothetical protein
MLTLKRSAAATLAAAAVIAGSTLGTAAPASAATATQCKTSSKTFSLPSKPDVTVNATICIQRYAVSGGYRYYKAWLSKVSWDGTSWFTGGQRFNDISVLARAEHGTTVVRNCAYGICEWNNLTSLINNNESGSKTFQSGSGGYGIAWVKTKSPNWLADATVTWDVTDDGKATTSWDLADTAAVY